MHRLQHKYVRFMMRLYGVGWCSYMKGASNFNWQAYGFQVKSARFWLFLFPFFLFQPLESLLSESVFQEPQIRLALLVLQLIRLMRKDSVIAFPKWVSFSEEIAHLPAPTNIPQLIESIDCLIKKIPQQKQGYDYILKPCFEFLFKWFMSCLPQLEAQDPTKWMWLSFGFTPYITVRLWVHFSELCGTFPILSVVRVKTLNAQGTWTPPLGTSDINNF